MISLMFRVHCHVGFVFIFLHGRSAIDIVVVSGIRLTFGVELIRH